VELYKILGIYFLDWDLIYSQQGLYFMRLFIYWEHVVKVVFKEVCWEGVDWIDFALERGMRWAIVNV